MCDVELRRDNRRSRRWLSPPGLTKRTRRSSVAAIVAVVINFLFSVALAASDRDRDMLRSKQCLVVTTASWSAQRGSLSAFERDAPGPWRLRFPNIAVVLGKNGLAWGRGLVPLGVSPGPEKEEDDDKAPAGVFRLGPVFGYAARRPITKMPYLPLTGSIVAVDDPRSRYYNEFVDTARIKNPDWRTAEKMILADDRYKWGVCVGHNFPPEPGAGSCIFLHVWKTPATPTTGCSAMAERDLLNIIKWLDPARQPVLVQLPRPVYDQVRQALQLPRLSS